MLLGIIAVQFAEIKKGRMGFQLGVQLLALILVVLYYFFCYNFDIHETHIRFLVLYIGLHLLISVLPYIAVKQRNGFWQFNETLFLNIHTALLYSLILSTGISLVLTALIHFAAH